MRKWMRILLLAGLFAVLLGTSALAVETGMQGVEAETGYSLAPKTADSQTVTPGMGNGATFHKDAVRVELTVKKTPDAEYLVFMLEDGTAPTETNIVYIDQKSNTEAGTDGLAFDLYPSGLKVGETYNIYVSSTNKGLAMAGSFVYETADDYKAYTPGDVTGDGNVYADDALQTLKFAVGTETPTATQALAANVDGDEKVTATDALKILKVAVGLDSL